MHFTGVGKKNNEISCLEKYIKDNIETFKNKIIICDRAYFCYEFIRLNIEKARFFYIQT